jgi:hypothetical protein
MLVRLASHRRASLSTRFLEHGGQQSGAGLGRLVDDERARVAVVM